MAKMTKVYTEKKMSKTPWVGKSILIVDDSKEVCESLADIYTSIGLKVDGMAHDGLEALERLKKKSSEFVSIDIIMPNMHGAELFSHLIKTEGPLCFFVTCFSADPLMLASLPYYLPKELFLEKPPGIIDLEAVCRLLLENKNVMRPVQEEAGAAKELPRNEPKRLNSQLTNHQQQRLIQSENAQQSVKKNKLEEKPKIVQEKTQSKPKVEAPEVKPQATKNEKKPKIEPKKSSTSKKKESSPKAKKTKK